MIRDTSNRRRLTAFGVAGLLLGAQSSAEARMAAVETPQSMIVAPFGFPADQPPPPGSVINLADFDVGYTAQQVCGYTDWSTLQLRLPKKLLSKDYWKNVGTGLENGVYWLCNG